MNEKVNFKDVVVPVSRPASHPNPSGAGDYSSIVGFMKQLAVANLHAQIAAGGGDANPNTKFRRRPQPSPRLIAPPLLLGRFGRRREGGGPWGCKAGEVQGAMLDLAGGLDLWNLVMCR